MELEQLALNSLDGNWCHEHSQTLVHLDNPATALSFAQANESLEYLAQGRAKGKVVVQIK